MPFENPNSNGVYLKLFVVILLGVTGGNLLSNWITVRVAEYRLEQTLAATQAKLKHESRQAQQAAAEAQARGQRDAEARQAAAQQARRNDRIGLKLAQACAEWTKANQELQSYTTRTEQDKACSRLNDYVQGGILPRP